MRQCMKHTRAHGDGNLRVFIRIFCNEMCRHSAFLLRKIRKIVRKIANNLIIPGNLMLRVLA